LKFLFLPVFIEGNSLSQGKMFSTRDMIATRKLLKPESA